MNPQLPAFFESLRSEADLQQLVQDRREEDLYLEFKTKADPSHGNLDGDDREGFSQTLSGFANADGGVLVFGVATTRSPNDVDQAAALSPLAHPGTFRARLLDSILNTTQPPVDGVRIEVIACPAGGGYVKCFVPPSDRPPHRAMLAKREYWRRTSTGHRRMEHYELEDTFGRRLRPVLRVGVKLAEPPGADPQEIVRLTFKNEGRGLARHAGLVCEIGEGKITATAGSLKDESALNDGRPMASYYNSQGVIHPNGLFSSLGSVVLQRATKGQPLRLSIKWYAEDMAPRDQTFEIRLHESLLLPL